MKGKIRLLLALLIPAMAVAQTSREEATADTNMLGGVYYAYPVPDDGISITPPPPGYEPFYISHYGRHGSRYLISDNDYLALIDPLRKAAQAGKLTPLGLRILDLAEKVWVEAEGRGGDLTPLGVRQLKGIGRRMAQRYPQVFDSASHMSARATTVMRVALSMDALCEALKEIEPRLDITRESSQRYMYYLNYHAPESNEFCSDRGPWRDEFNAWRKGQVNPGRMIEALFNDADYAAANIDAEALMWALYWVAVGQQNIETPGSFYDAITPDEMFDLWQVVNYDNYVRDSAYPGSGLLVVDNAKPLLRNILASADSIISSGGHGADLRFGHDGNLMPLAAILRLDGCFNDSASHPQDAYRAFANFKIAPMAGNIQILFFRNPADDQADVLVKFMLNEKEISIPLPTDTYPFYRWPQVREYYQSIIDAPTPGPLQ